MIKIPKIFTRRKQAETGDTGEGKLYQTTKHEVDGTTLISFDHALGLPMRRKIAFFQTTHEASLRIAGPDLEAYISLVDDLCDKGDFSKIKFTNGILRQYRDLYSSHRTMFPVGNCLILLEGEPTDQVTPIYTHRKKELFESSEEIRDFFLLHAIESVLKLSKPNDATSILDYLKGTEVKATERIFSNLIQRFMSPKI